MLDKQADLATCICRCKILENFRTLFSSVQVS